jgi:hypothetical protein
MRAISPEMPWIQAVQKLKNSVEKFKVSPTLPQARGPHSAPLAI